MEWLTSLEIKREVAKRTGRYVHYSVIGGLAKKHKLYKGTFYGFRLYHKKLIDILEKYLEEYYAV